MSRATLTSVLCAVAVALSAVAVPTAAADADRYRNPLEPRVRGGGTVESCADPVVLRGRGEDRKRWYMFCTTDPLNDAETAPEGDPPFHPIPMLVSRDLVSWRYVGDALPEKPSWAAEEAGLWAPDLVYSRATDRYYLTFVVTDTTDETSGEPGCDSDSAIGVATSRNPTGPWRISDTPVVPPRQNGDGCDFYWTYDPDVLGDAVGRRSVLYYGSYYGGVHGQRVELTRRGMESVGVPTMVGIGNRYEGTNVVRRGGWYYYFGSATNCCNGPLTGYSVFTGRSRSPMGPFVDRHGNSLLAGRVGGTPALSMNGNRWVGSGHNSVFRDRAGQWWMAYHAVDRNDPYFDGEPGFTKRPALLDPVTWRGGWPSVRADRWASDRSMPAPAAQPGERRRYRPDPVRPHRQGRLLPRFSDRFAGDSVDDAWSWVRPPEPETYGVEGGAFRFDVQTADLYVDSNDASVLTRPAPARDFVVQTRVTLDLPAEGCCFNFAQAGLALYGSDDAFLKLTHAGLWETRQTEWAKEIPSGRTRYGNSVVGPPGDETWLRIVKQTRGGKQLFTGYTSQDGSRWVRGGTWVHNRLGDDLRIGLVSMGKTPEVTEAVTARFDHVRTWALRR
jgi:arabinan endo-1,5-alpha-L-arabinosidase